jgi:hypothetical protein
VRLYRYSGGKSVDLGLSYLVELPTNSEGGFVGGRDVVSKDRAVDNVDYYRGVSLEDGYVVICNIGINKGFIFVWYIGCDLETYLDRKYFGFRFCLLRHTVCLVV